jgi:hypothetical protein
MPNLPIAEAWRVPSLLQTLALTTSVFDALRQIRHEMSRQ